MMRTITRQEVSDLGGAPDATHVVLHSSGELYLCVKANDLDEEHESSYWAARGDEMKRVITGGQHEKETSA